MSNNNNISNDNIKVWIHWCIILDYQNTYANVNIILGKIKIVTSYFYE